MAEVRNIFVKSKMNKDLDERLLPSGEYRDGRNISISKSEGPDEGVVENILGNIQYSNFGFASNTEIIGTYADTDKDRIYIFATNFTDSSQDQLSNFPVSDVPHPAGGTIPGAECYIAYIQGPLNNTVSPAFDILVQGSFLNFSKTHPMLGVDLIEDLLFFTDNRNQPRKINVETAISSPYVSSSNPGYYFNEDHISVAKFMPFSPISFLNSSNNNTMKDNLSEYLPPHSTSVVDSITASNVILEFKNIDIATSPVTRFKNIMKPELGYFKLTNISGNDTLTFEYPIGSGNTGSAAMAAANAAAVEYFGAGSVAFTGGATPDVIQFEQVNPDYNSNFEGDEDYLKDKFVRFSYRFKYDDGEYSLMAPFTQALFIPKNFGYFSDTGWNGITQRDEKDTANSGIVKFMENQVTSASFKIDLPPRYNIDVASPTAGPVQTEFFNEFKVTEIQILAKESDGLAIKVVDEIIVEDSFTSNTDRFYIYQYESAKPFKTLTEAVTTRVHDKVPIRAKAQATASNRIIYGNFQEKHGSPENLDYFLAVSEKKSIGSPASGYSYSRKEYINHTLKQNRSYKVGVVLVDRYGRSSNVILRDEAISIGISGEKSSIYAPYENPESTLNWPGNNLKISFADLIPPNKTSNYPGLFNGIYVAGTSSPYKPATQLNPTGYMTYKVVVQQLGQEYYNVYTPGATSGQITFTGQIGTSASAGVGSVTYKKAASISNIVLYGDNINKVPKELKDVGPTEEIYGSQTLLYPRVVTRYITSPTNYPTAWLASIAQTESSQVSGKNEFTVNSILSYNDLGKWTQNNNLKPIANSVYPNFSSEYVDPLYLEASSNPFVAQLETNFLVGFSPTRQSVGSASMFSKNLNVFETNPVESKIEIYYETSTSGLIKPLNTLISAGSLGIGVDIGTPIANPEPISLTAAENIVPSAAAWICPEFQAVDAQNNLLSTGTIELINVTNGNDGIINPSPFELVNTAGFKYRLRVDSTTTGGFYYGSDSNDRTFNVNLRIKANGNNVVTKQLLLSNIAPSLSPIPENPAAPIKWYEGEAGNPIIADPGGINNPYYLSANPLTTLFLQPGESTGTINRTTGIFNGSYNTNLDQEEVIIQKSGTAISQTLFDIVTTNTQYDLRIISDEGYIASLGNGTKVLLKIIVKDANGASGFKFTYYSTYIQILI